MTMTEESSTVDMDMTMDMDSVNQSCVIMGLKGNININRNATDHRNADADADADTVVSSNTNANANVNANVNVNNEHKYKYKYHHDQCQSQNHNNGIGRMNAHVHLSNNNNNNNNNNNGHTQLDRRTHSPDGLNSHVSNSTCSPTRRSSPVPQDIQNTETNTIIHHQHSRGVGIGSTTTTPLQHQQHHQQQQHHQHQQQSFSLPPELKQILREVARTGKCASLPWTASGIGSSNAKRSLKYKRAAKKKRRYEKQMAKELRAAASHINININDNASGGNGNGNLHVNGNLHANGNVAQHTIKWENNSNIDDSSVKSNTSKISNASTSRVHEKKVVIESHHVDHINHINSKESSVSVGGGSYADTGSLASLGSKRSVDLSTSTRASIQTELKKRKFYTRGSGGENQSACSYYASSCSESVSSAGGGSMLSIPSSSASMGPLCLSLPFRTLRGALRLAVALVLEYSYKHRGGYKLSPAEKRQFEVLQQAIANRGREKNAAFLPSQTDVAFMERRMRLLKMLGGGKNANANANARPTATRFLPGNTSDGGFTSDTSFDSAMRRKTSEDFAQSNYFGPPFTIQRVAEVLLMPERYYGQTHKLCNALEKLLLVTSPLTAFGGVKGGDTSQNRREEKELTALANKKERDKSAQRQRRRRLKRRISSSSADGCDPIIQMDVSVETPESKRLLANTNQPEYPISAKDITTVNASNIGNDQIRHLTPNPLINDSGMLSVMTEDTVDLGGPPVSVNMVQSVNNSYQHVMGVQNQAFSENSNVFPSESLRVTKGVTDEALRALQGNDNRSTSSMLQHAVALNRPSSPSLYSSQGLNQMMTSHQASVLQGHHGGVLDAAALRAGQNVQMEIVIDPESGNSVASPVQSGVTGTHVTYLDQVEVGRSSASNSDIDSESDDISFDDSASDRSDGSDFDPGTFTAARVMALNRMHQQHRRE